MDYSYYSYVLYNILQWCVVRARRTIRMVGVGYH